MNLSLPAPPRSALSLCPVSIAAIVPLDWGEVASRGKASWPVESCSRGNRPGSRLQPSVNNASRAAKSGDIAGEAKKQSGSWGCNSCQ